MRVAYFDCIGGISGDMVLGALVDAGLSAEGLKSALKRLALSNYQIKVRKVDKRGVRATKVQVETAKGAPQASGDIKKLIRGSGLKEKVKRDAVSTFSCLAEAEAAVHGTTAEEVHFHEVGAVDSIVDIVGACIGLSELGIERVHCSPLSVSRPAPATLEILKGLTIETRDAGIESVTPTGAALMKTLARDFGQLPPMKLEATGYGAGDADTETPNVLRLLLGEASSIPLPASSVDPEQVLLLETNIDDLSPEILGYVMDKLFEAGALDVWFTPIYMKKNRPAVTLSVLARPEKERDISALVFRETGTLGLRSTLVTRQILDREEATVETKFGKVRVKIGQLGGEIVSVTPEYENCRRLAEKSGRSLKEIYHEAVKAFHSSH